MEAKSQIGFEQAGLGSILKHNQLVVPANQREYAWAERQRTQLFQDFARALTHGGDYFIGTIVTIPRRDGTLEVVDGQQRLATTAILLSAIRNYLRSKNETILVEAIDNEFLTGIDRVKRERVPKLKLNVDDNDLFSAIVVSGSFAEVPVASARESHDLLREAATQAQQYIETIVASLDPKDHGDELNRWVSFIEHRALAVLLRVPDDADAYKMFETLNDRGLRTSQADLIKNYLFGRSAGRISEVQARWAHMRGALESLDEDEITTVTFLRHALIVLGGPLREVEVYDRVQEHAKSEQQAITFAATLETLANAYVASFSSEHARWNNYPGSARQAIEVLNVLDIKPIRPLLLAITAYMPEKETTAALQFLLSLGVRLLLAFTTRSGSVETPLAEAANEVAGGKIANVAQLRAKIAGITPTDHEFQNACETVRVSNTRLARYYLRSLELTAQGQKEPWFIPTNDHAFINLEHVLPKKPGMNWSEFMDEEAKAYVNRLGNLALLQASSNSKLHSDSFADKQPILATSPYILTSEIGTVSAWSPQAITDRQKRLAALAVATWPVR